MDADDDFFDKALEGFAMFALNQGEVCTCPSRALVQESIYDRFMERAVARMKAIVEGNPLDPNTMIGAQASNDQLEKILSYIDIGKKEGAKVLTGGARRVHAGELEEGYYVQPTILEGHNRMRVFQEEIFGPVVSVTKFKDQDDALAIANDTLYGLGAGLWSRDANTCYRMGRAIKAGRVWTNCYHAYPGARGVRRLQAVGHRAREPQDDAGSLPADEEHAGQLQPQEAWLLLMENVARVEITDAAATVLRQLEAQHGPLLFHQSGGCCDGSSPMCFPRASSSGPAGRAAGRGGGRAGLHRCAAVRGVAAHPAADRRGARARRRLLPRGPARGAVPHPIAGVRPAEQAWLAGVRS